jgi:hypothetical protein
VKDQVSRGRKLTYAHEFLLAVNIALVAKWWQENGRIIPLSNLLAFDHEYIIQDRINALLGLHPHNNVGGDLAFFAVTLGWALSLFLLMRLVLILLPKLTLRWSGLFPVTALPIICLYRSVPPLFPNPPVFLVLLELFTAVVCCILYISKWLLSTWPIILLLVLHFVFWGWLFLGGPYVWRSPVGLSTPLAGLISSLVWGMYVKRADSMTLSAPSSE